MGLILSRGGQRGSRMDRDIEEKVKGNPSSRLFAPLADRYRKAGLVEKAIDILLRGLQRHPRYVSARVLLARCYVEQGDLEKAREEYLGVLDLDAGNLVALKALGEISRRLGDLEASRGWFRSYLDEFPGDEEMRLALSEIEVSLRDRQTGATAEMMGGERVPVPEHPDYVVKDGCEGGEETATGAGITGDSPVDDEDLEEGDSLETITLADIYARQGFFERALQIYRKIISQDPANEEVRKRIAELEHRLSTGTDGEPGRITEETEDKPDTVHDICGEDECESVGPPGGSYGDVESKKTVSINEAGQIELETIPGVGPVIAQKIIVERERNGPFESIRDLERVPSLGRKMIERVGPYLKFEQIAPMSEEDASEETEWGPVRREVELDEGDEEVMERGVDVEFEEFRRWLKNLRK